MKITFSFSNKKEKKRKKNVPLELLLVDKALTKDYISNFQLNKETKIEWKTQRKTRKKKRCSIYPFSNKDGRKTKKTRVKKINSEERKWILRNSERKHWTIYRVMHCEFRTLEFKFIIKMRTKILLFFQNCILQNFIYFSFKSSMWQVQCDARRWHNKLWTMKFS